MGALVEEAFALLALTAANKAAGARARGDDAAAAKYGRLHDTFKTRAQYHLTVELCACLDGAEVEVHIAEG
jgi:hypothetical protein